MSGTTPGVGCTSGSPQPHWDGHPSLCQALPCFWPGWCLAAMWWCPAPHGLSVSRYNEINAISTACSYGITECQDLAIKYFQEWKQNDAQNP